MTPSKTSLLCLAMLLAVALGDGCSDFGNNKTACLLQSTTCGWCTFGSFNRTRDSPDNDPSLCVFGGPNGPENNLCCSAYEHHDEKGNNDVQKSVTPCDDLSYCGELCSGILSKCRADTKCGAAYDCIVNDLRFLGCNATCVSRCSAGITDAATKLLLNRTVSCIQARCLETSTECVPSECVSERGQLSAYAGSSSALECFYAMEQYGNICDDTCIVNCIRKPRIEPPPLLEVLNYTDCYVPNSQTCRPISESQSKICRERCADAFKVCGSHSTCLDGMICLARTPDCVDTPSCLLTCISLTTENTPARSALLNAISCRSTCSQVSCSSKFCSSDYCPSRFRCVDKFDRCARYTSAAECSAQASCRFDRAEQTCNSTSSVCQGLDQTLCGINSRCEWLDHCHSRPCEVEVRNALLDCLDNNICASSLLCTDDDDSSCDVVPTDPKAALLFVRYLRGLARCDRGTTAPEPIRTGLLTDFTIRSRYNCTACNSTLEECHRYFSCRVGLIAAAQYLNQHIFCGDDCLASARSIGGITANSASDIALTKALECYSEKCSYCRFHCAAPIKVCQASTLCNQAYLKVDAAVTKSGLCDGQCFNEALSLIPEATLVRELFVDVMRCMSSCQASGSCGETASSETCALPTLDTIDQAADCAWQSSCVPKVDECRTFDKTACDIATACQWNGIFCVTVADTQTCLALTSETSCKAQSKCRWSSQCAPQRDCIESQCVVEVDDCLMHDACTSAWQCLRSATSPSYTIAQQCASKAQLTGEARALFQAVASCYVQCKAQNVSDDACSADIERCGYHDDCSYFLSCLRSCSVLDRKCQENCLFDSAGADGLEDDDEALAKSEGVVIATSLFTCLQDQYRSRECSPIRDSKACAFTDGCTWSKRCVKGNSANCRQYLSASTCGAGAGLCAWDDFAQRCIASADGCINKGALEKQQSLVYYKGQSLGDVSLLLLHNGTCPSDCHTESLCIPDQRSDRLCYNRFTDCMNSQGCLRAHRHALKCNGDGDCVNEVLSIDSTVYQNDFTRCLGEAKIEGCSSSCRPLMTACHNDRVCDVALSCVIEHLAYGPCGTSCYQACTKIFASSPDSSALFAPAFGCILRLCSPYFQQHQTCSAVTDYSPAFKVGVKKAVCEASNCLGVTRLGSAVPCSWNDTNAVCSCSQPESCTGSLDSCFDCCQAQHKTCLVKGSLDACAGAFNQCTAKCSPLFTSNAQPGMVDVTVSLQLELDAETLVYSQFTLSDFVSGFYGAFVNPPFERLDVYLTQAEFVGVSEITTTTTTTTKATTTKATTTKKTSTATTTSTTSTTSTETTADTTTSMDTTPFEMTDSDTTTTTVNTRRRRREASPQAKLTFVMRLEEADTTNVIGSVNGVDFAASIQNATGVLVESAAFTQQAVEVVQPQTDTPTQRYLVSSELFTLPAGAYLTPNQINLALNQYMTAYGLELDSEPDVTVEGQDIIGRHTRLGPPTDADLAPHLLSIQYTLANDTVVTESSQTPVSTSQKGGSTGGSSSSSSESAEIAIGVAIGCVILVAVIVFIVVDATRLRRAPIAPVGSSQT